MNSSKPAIRQLSLGLLRIDTADTVSHLLYLVDLCLPPEFQLIPQGLHLVVMLPLELCSRQSTLESLVIRSL